MAKFIQNQSRFLLEKLNELDPMLRPTFVRTHDDAEHLFRTLSSMNYDGNLMARVSISEAARLVIVSRPTIYKMINSGKLSYTSVVKHGKGIKVIDTSELIRSVWFS